MICLKQIVLLVYDWLKISIVPYSYYPILEIIGIWKYKTRLIIFCLYVNNFRVKYWSKEDADYLCNTIGINYKYIVNQEENHYYRLNLN